MLVPKPNGGAKAKLLKMKSYPRISLAQYNSVHIGMTAAHMFKKLDGPGEFYSSENSINGKTSFQLQSSVIDTIIKHVIDLEEGGRPATAAYYRQNPKNNEIIDETVKQLLQEDRAERSYSA
ncbi:unnamed protein product [Didymodactylos carnosus]|uniref:Uncharacterized protein n=2 Tax=Didymodactylos carnosus TaxID=1234261 RepID=A0A8S2E7J4_9BILA|nr:unnamed protein product [Didymodactylos carnosus]CAF3962889.1 unnamed protein product [Didymodactylos carnosus]